MRNFFLFLVFNVLFGFTALAQQIDTLNIFSPSMAKTVKTIVINPLGGNNLPVVFILHGYSGNPERTLQKDIPSLFKMSADYKMIFVVPDGNYDSWYIDSPVSNSKYETFITSELVPFINSNYHTEKSKKAVVGWSMGGHGALYLGMRHPDTFSAIGSICGAINFLPYGKEYGVTKILGNRSARWKNFTAISQAKKVKKSTQKILISCGVDDPFIRQNRELHKLFLKNRINHFYIESPGKHNAEYWSAAAENQIYLLNRYFQENDEK